MFPYFFFFGSKRQLTPEEERRSIRIFALSPVILFGVLLVISPLAARPDRAVVPGWIAALIATLAYFCVLAVALRRAPPAVSLIVGLVGWLVLIGWGTSWLFVRR